MRTRDKTVLAILVGSLVAENIGYYNRDTGTIGAAVVVMVVCCLYAIFSWS